MARPRRRLLFRIRCYIIALLVAMLPVIYTLIIITLTGLTLWHVDKTVRLINFSTEFGVRDLELILMIILEGTGAFLLCRQVITPEAPADTRQELQPGDQPEFFEVVRLVAEKVGSPVPQKVQVDSSAGLLADYTSSWNAVLASKLQIRMGLSLPVAFDAAEMVAMLAHELGFFSAGTGSATARFIRGVHRWFVLRIRHDPWLTWLHERSISRRSSWRWLLLLGWFLIWLSLRPLRLLYGLCRLISGETMRQMVYKADDCAAQLAGSDATARAIEKRALAMHTWRKAHERTRQQSTDRLPDNIPLLVLRELLFNDALLDDEGPRATHWLDMAPPDEVRKARVLRMKCPGLLDCEGEGTSFFRNFHESARRVTYFHYLNDWGLPVNLHRLVAVEETVHERRATMETVNILNRYFRGLAHPERAFCGIAEEHTGSRDVDVLKLELQDCRDWLKIYSERMASSLADWSNTWQLVRDLETAYLLCAAGLPTHKGQFAISNPTPEGFREEINRQRGIMDNMEGILRQFEGKLETRLASALELLWRCEPDQLPPKLQEVQAPLSNWVLVYEALGLHMPVLREMMTHFHAFQSLGASVAGVVDSASYVTTVQNQIPRLTQLVKDILVPLSQWPFPFQTDDSDQPISLACYLAPMAMEPGALNFESKSHGKITGTDLRAKAQQNAKRLTQIVAPLLDRYLSLYHQAFAWVTKTADMAEWHFLDPLAPEFNVDPQELLRAKRYVPEPPPPPKAIIDPELAYQHGVIIAA